MIHTNTGTVITIAVLLYLLLAAILGANLTR